MTRISSKNILLVLIISMAAPAIANDSGGYFTPAEIAAAYRYQEHHGRRLRHPLKPFGCYTGQSEFTAWFDGKEFSAPCRFVTETTRHLKSLLEQRAAKYLFPLDADHAHLIVPTALWQDKYSKLAGAELLAQLLREPKLVALYHTAEYVAGADPKTGKENLETRQWRAKRNALTMFDGSPLKILAPSPSGAAVDEPEGFMKAGTVHFLAHRLGEIAMSADGRAVVFDLSFDEDLAIPTP